MSEKTTSDTDQELINRRACPECAKLKQALDTALEALCQIAEWNVNSVITLYADHTYDTAKKILGGMK